MVFDCEIGMLEKTKNSLTSDIEQFIADLDYCKGKIVFSGMGKSGHICKKIVATMQSLGIDSAFMHPAEAMHGDLGVVSEKDVVVLVSNSGETKEMTDLLPSLKTIGATIFGIIGRKGSTIELEAKRSIIMPDMDEAFLEMVPTSSTTTTLVIGDAIAVAIAKRRGFDKSDFGILHPSGQLGKKLTLKVKDVMISGSENAVILNGTTVEQAMFEMCKRSVGCVSIVNKSGKLLGLFTDGDLRRLISNSVSSNLSKSIDEFMIRKPITLFEDELLFDTIKSTISKHSVSTYPVVNGEGIAVGTLRMIDVLKSGMAHEL